MAEGRARLLHFDLTADDEVVWGWGLGCNGVIDVFVEPADGAVHAAGTIRRAVDQQQALVAVTVVQLSEDGGVRLGARLIVHADGTVDGSLGDPSIDRQARSEGLRALEDGRSGTLPLGEEIRAFFEVLVPPLRLIVCGAGHDAVPLVRFASGLGWKVEVVDDREQFLKPRRFPDAARRAGVDERTYVVVMSHNFPRDKDYLRSFLGSTAPYIGMLGPAARLERLLAELRREGYDPDPRDLEVVHGPAGLDLGGDGPEEVAWAIVGEVLAVAKGRRGGFLRDRGGPIHDRAGPAHDPVAAKRG